jgi:hypothetical protein
VNPELVVLHDEINGIIKHKELNKDFIPPTFVSRREAGI